MFFSTLFWLTDWASIFQTFPCVVSFQLPPDLNNIFYIINHSVLLFLSFMYSFLTHLFDIFILFSAGHVPVSTTISVFVVLASSLNILFKAFYCILSISIFFISSFFRYPHASFPYIMLTRNKLQKVLITLWYPSRPIIWS